MISKGARLTRPARKTFEFGGETRAERNSRVNQSCPLLDVPRSSGDFPRRLAPFHYFHRTLPYRLTDVQSRTPSDLNFSPRRVLEKTSPNYTRHLSEKHRRHFTTGVVRCARTRDRLANRRERRNEKERRIDRERRTISLSVGGIVSYRGWTIISRALHGPRERRPLLFVKVLGTPSSLTSSSLPPVSRSSKKSKTAVASAAPRLTPSY